MSYGVLTGPEIEKQYAAGNIIIYPKNRPAGPNSYDVALGEYYWRQSAGPYSRPAGKSMYFIHEQHSIDSNWMPGKAKTWEETMSELVSAELLTQEEVAAYYTMFDQNDLIILLNPGELILAHTEEFIGSVGTAPITTEMKARSSAGRSGISVCKCAGMGDPGYCTRWTMEIKNEGNKIVPLKVGMCLAQIVFISTAGEVVSYAKDGHYFQAKNEENRDLFIKSMISSWSPEMMLPAGNAFNKN